LHKGNIAHASWRDPWNKKIYTHSIKEGEQISIKPLQDKGHHGEILKTMKEA
jgi:hypothetical protein